MLWFLIIFSNDRYCITKGILPEIFLELYFNLTRKNSVFIVWTDMLHGVIF